MGLDRGVQVNSGGRGPEADGCGILPIVTDTQQSLVVLILTPDDGHGCPGSLRMS